MPRGGGKTCEPGCTCNRHGRARRIDWGNPEERRAYNRQKNRERYSADPGPQIEASRRWREKNPGRRAEWRSTTDREWKYGLSAEAVAQLVAEQDGKCYLCREPLDLEKKRGIHVDHDHACCRGAKTCGKCIRGLACHACNTGIGAFGDDPERMMRVAGRLAAASAVVAARLAETPVQAELFDINQAASRQSKESALWLLAKAWGVCSTASRRSRGTPPRTGCR
jgi:hypothetical protein